MAFEKILVPTDGSDFTKNAIENGIRVAKLTGGSITAAYILDQSVYASMPMDTTVVNLYETLKAEGDAAVNYARKRCDAEGVTCIEKVVDGVPWKTISEMSREHDLIVMGTMGKKGMTKLLMGSVAEKVIENAQCPVMIISAAVKKVV